MFYVSISNEALRKVIEDAKSRPSQRVVGFLIGSMEGQTLIIEDAVSGEIESGATEATLPAETIARIANDIVNQKIRGNIVGWYHTHPGYGIFMSDVDILTQHKLQQFSPYIVALVVDPSSNNIGIFTLNAQTGLIVPISHEYIYFFNPTEAQAPPATQGKHFRYRPESFSSAARMGLFIIGLLLAGIFFGTALLGSSPTIEHRPPTQGLAGSSIMLNATISGTILGVKSVTLHYKLGAVPYWKSTQSLPLSPGSNLYVATIPSQEVIGDISYYITAVDNLGRVSNSQTFTISFSDFYVSTSPRLVIYAGRSETSIIEIKSSGNFNSPVTLSLQGLPVGASCKLVPELVAPPINGSTQSTLIVSTTAATASGNYTLTVAGVAGQLGRQCQLILLIPDFNISSTPLRQVVARGESAIFEVALTPLYGFATDIFLEVLGLPLGTAASPFRVPENKISLSGSMILTLSISTSWLTARGTHTLTILGVGGGRTHLANVTLEVR